MALILSLHCPPLPAKQDMDGYIRMPYYLHQKEQFGGRHDSQRYPS
jgi:hypothetical protein